MQWKDFKLALIITPVVLLAGVISTIILYRLLYPAMLPALRFDRSSRVEIPSAPDLEFGNRPFSVSLWLRTTTSQKNVTFIAKRASALGDGWGIFGQGDNQFLFYAAGCASPMSSPQNYRDGQWHHLAVVRHEARVDLYHDSQLVGSGPERCSFLDHHPISVGMDGERGEHLEGELAEVRIYNRALSPAEVAAEWSQGKGSSQSAAAPGLVAGYHFDEDGGGVARDFSGAGHDGALINNPERTKDRR
jgi:hypothetical protein